MKNNKLEEFDREVDYELTNSLSPITFGKLQQFINDNYISKEEVEKLETYQISNIPMFVGKELIIKDEIDKLNQLT